MLRHTPTSGEPNGELLRDLTGDITGDWSTVGNVSPLMTEPQRNDWLSRAAAGVGVGLLGMSLLSALGLTAIRSRIERTLTQQTSAALKTAGLSMAKVEFVGRDATVRIPRGLDETQVASYVRTASNPVAGFHLAGPRTVRVVVDDALGVVAPVANEWDSKLRATVSNGGNVLLEGLVQEEAANAAMQSGVVLQLPGAAVVSQLQVSPRTGVAVGESKWVGQIAGELGRVGNGSGSVEFTSDDTKEGGTVTITGNVATAELRDALESFAMQSGFSVQNKLMIRANTEVSDSGPVPFEEGVASPDTAAAQQTIDTLLQQQTIEFTSGSAELTERGRDVVTQVAAVLEANSSTNLLIVGHTDSNGSPEANLRLSLARAEAVRLELEQKGIAAARLTASGEGDTKPVATNDTPEGRKANRRIDLSVG
jgi:outer membrane protein OmpA-like peptidoglycan-associated protein